MFQCTLTERYALIEIEHWLFFLAVCNCQNHLVKKLRGPFHQIDVTVGDGIKCTRINYGFHEGGRQGLVGAEVYDGYVSQDGSQFNRGAQIIVLHVNDL